MSDDRFAYLFGEREGRIRLLMVRNEPLGGILAVIRLGFDLLLLRFARIGIPTFSGIFLVAQGSQSRNGIHNRVDLFLGSLARTLLTLFRLGHWYAAATLEAWERL